MSTCVGIIISAAGIFVNWKLQRTFVSFFDFRKCGWQREKERREKKEAKKREESKREIKNTYAQIAHFCPFLTLKHPKNHPA